MSENVQEPEVEEARHLEVEEYGDDELEESPDWYDDTVNVGEESNALAEPVPGEPEGEES